MTDLPAKYRPTAFAGVVGQKEAVHSLQAVIKGGRAKKFIFSGPSGIGKTTLARIVANALGAVTALNLIEISAADHTGVEDMRQVIANTYYRALGTSPTKAIILDEAHRLSGSAWDVLLKPIEEPPAHVCWFICTTNLGKVPKTIQTRCLRYDLKLVSEDDLFKLLCKVADAEKLDVVDDVLDAIAEGAGGSPRQALQFLEACQYAEGVSDARQLMRSAAQSREVIDLCRFLIKGRGNWTDAMRLLNMLEGVEAEGVRITVVNYLAAAARKATGNAQAASLIGLMQCFDTPYQQSDRLAPLLKSIGLALEIDRR